MKFDAEIHNKILANSIQQYTKRTKHHDQVGFIPRVQGWFNIQKSINVIHYVNKLKNKIIRLSQLMQKTTSWQNSTFIHDKILNKVGIEETYLYIIKAIYDQPTITSNQHFIINAEKLKAFSLISGKVKNAHSHHFYSK